MKRTRHGPEIEEGYSTPLPLNVRTTVERLLRSVPAQYISGISMVILTDTGTMTSARKKGKVRSDGRKLVLGEAWALYHPKDSAREARIEIFVDNILSYWSPRVLRIPLFRDQALAKVLFHEIGHHICHAVVPCGGSPEKAAERWCRKLSRTYLVRRYWYLVPLFTLYGVIRRLCRTTQADP
jgi:hypothetical protein